MSDSKRADLLDSDAIYQANARALLHRWNQRKINDSEFSTIQSWLVHRALRRATIASRSITTMSLAFQQAQPQQQRAA